MKSSRSMMALGAMMAMAGVGGLVPIGAEEVEPGKEPRNNFREQHRPSGSKPVPGGGARERARRLAQLSKSTERE